MGRCPRLCEDPDKVLHPNRPDAAAEAPVRGLAAAERSLCWKIGEGGRAGDVYRVRLQLNGNGRRLAWDKVQDPPLSAAFRPRCPHGFSIIGDHSFWTFEAMARTSPGSFATELCLLKAFSNFQIFRDADFGQGFYPAPGAMEEAGGRQDPEKRQMVLSGEAILGPDAGGDGLNFRIAGKVGDVFRVNFERRASTASVSWEKVGWRAVDFEELAKGHAYSIVGSWDDFKSGKEMERDACGNWSVEVSVEKVETFQILLNGNWLAAVHPSIPVASLGDSFAVEGPDEAGHGKYFCLGTADGDCGGGAMVAAVIHLEIQGGFPSRVWWERSNSERAHELRIAQGAGRLLQRHLRLMGLLPYDEETRAPARIVEAPDWWDGGHVQKGYVAQKRLEDLQASFEVRRKQLEQDGPEAQLRREQERMRMASLA